MQAWDAQNLRFGGSSVVLRESNGPQDFFWFLSCLLRCCVVCSAGGVGELFQKGANPNFEDEFGVTPLMNAALRGNLRSAVLLRVLQSNWKEMPELHAGHVSMRFPAP